MGAEGQTGRRFDEAFIDDVKARTSIVNLIGESLRLTKKGREWTACCPFHKEKTPSFTVNEEKAFYHCFGCGAHGSVFTWMIQAHGLTFVEAVEDLAIRAGLQPDRDGRTKPKPAPVVQRPSDADVLAEKDGMIRWARTLWQGCQPAAGSLVGTYLRSRGIRVVPPPPTLRFHPNLKHSDTGLYFPAMVAAVQNAEGRITGVHRTFLLPDGRGKAQVASPKKMGGVCQGGAVRFAKAAKRLYLGEGIESSLSVMVCTGKPVWATLSLNNFNIPLPPVVQEVVLCIDNDSQDKDRDAHEEVIRKATQYHAQAGRSVRVSVPDEGCDFNDMLLKRGA